MPTGSRPRNWAVAIAAFLTFFATLAYGGAGQSGWWVWGAVVLTAACLVLAVDFGREVALFVTDEPWLWLDYGSWRRYKITHVVATYHDPDHWVVYGRPAW